MKLLIALIALTVSAAEAPILTDAQKLTVREAQLAISNNRAEVAESELKIRDLLQRQPALQKAFDDARMAVTPEGWKLQPDMTLVRCKWTEEEGCKAVAKK